MDALIAFEIKANGVVTDFGNLTPFTQTVV